MKGKSALMTAVAVVALVASQSAFAQRAPSNGTSAPSQSVNTGPSNAELEARIEALEAEVQANEQRQATVNTAEDTKLSDWGSKLSGWWNNTTVSGTAFIDVSNIEHETNGSKTGNLDNGTGFDLKRFYVAIDHKFDDVWSANITTDVTYDSNLKASQIFLKKAYIQAHVWDGMLTVRVGASDLPWVPFVESLYGYRYVENVLIDRTKFGTSTDWGAHIFGSFSDGLFNYAFSVVNGAGYKNIPIGSGANRSNSVDFEGRVNVNWDGFVLGVGGYSGDLGKDVQGAVIDHTAQRLDAVAAYTTSDIHVGFEYFKANDWNNVTTTTKDAAEGYGAFASWKFMPQFAVFGRYDYVTPNQDTNNLLHDNYYNFGVTWSPAKIIDISLVYKHDEASHGTIATSNGTIGGSTNGSYSEVGLFTQLKW